MRATFMVLALAGIAHADPHADADQHARQGIALYKLGKYEEAIVEFEDAYKAFQSDALLYNLAQAHRKLEHCDKALTYYHQYLAGEPVPELARQVEKLLPELEAACRTKDARPEATAPVAEATPSPAPEPAVEQQAAPVEESPLHLGANAFVGEVISAGNAPITGIHATGTYHVMDELEIGGALGVGEMFRYDAMDRATIVTIGAVAEHRTEFDWGRATVAGELGVEWFSLLGNSGDVVPGVAHTNQWAPLVRGEVGIEHDISHLFAVRAAIAGAFAPGVGNMSASAGELDLVVGVRYTP
ncbi:MAG: tetratricopeptide repeat protein [Kofleriaceae bacterium]